MKEFFDVDRNFMPTTLIVGTRNFVSEIAPSAKSSGVSVIACQTVRDALNLVHAQRCDFAVIQEALEDGPAEQLLNELRQTARSLPVVVVLVRRDADRALSWMEAGAYECLYQPLNFQHVSAVIDGTVRSLAGSFVKKPSLFRRWAAKPAVKKAAAVFAATLLLCAAGGFYMRSVQKARAKARSELSLSFRLPYPNPTGIAWDGKNLWVSDWSTQTVYKHAVDSGLTLEKFFPLSDIPLLSLAWGDSALWSVGQDGAVRKHLLDGRLTVVATVRLAGQTPAALAWDGKNLWSCDAQARKIVRHANDDHLTGQAAYEFPGRNPVGMAWLGRDLWVADEGTGTVYRLRYDRDVFTLQESFRPGVHMPGANKLSGLCSDRMNLWTVSEGNGLIFRHPLPAGKEG